MQVFWHGASVTIFNGKFQLSKASLFSCTGVDLRINKQQKSVVGVAVWTLRNT